MEYWYDEPQGPGPVAPGEEVAASPPPPSGRNTAAWVIGIVLVLLAVFLVAWLVGGDSDPGPVGKQPDPEPTAVGWRCVPAEGACAKVYPGDGEEAEYDLDELSDCEDGCEEPPPAQEWYCDQTYYSCRLRDAAPGTGDGYRYEVQCLSACVAPENPEDPEVPEEPVQRYSCDPLTGTCRKDPNGRFDEPGCGTGCKMTTFRCNPETGACDEDPTATLSLANCQKNCKFSCDPANGECREDRNSKHTLAQCRSRCRFYCSASLGTCLQDERYDDDFQACTQGCRFACNPATGSCERDASGTDLKACAAGCTRVLSPTEFKVRVDPAAEWPGLDDLEGTYRITTTLHCGMPQFYQYASPSGARVRGMFSYEQPSADFPDGRYLLVAAAGTVGQPACGQPVNNGVYTVNFQDLMLTDQVGTLRLGDLYDLREDPGLAPIDYPNETGPSAQ